MTTDQQDNRKGKKRGFFLGEGRHQKKRRRDEVTVVLLGEENAEKGGFWIGIT